MRDFPRTIGMVTNRELPKKGGSIFLPPIYGERGETSADSIESGLAIRGRRLVAALSEASRFGSGNLATFPAPNDPPGRSKLVRLMGNAPSSPNVARELSGRERFGSVP